MAGLADQSSNCAFLSHCFRAIPKRHTKQQGKGWVTAHSTEPHVQRATTGRSRSSPRRDEAYANSSLLSNTPDEFLQLGLQLRLHPLLRPLPLPLLGDAFIGKLLHTLSQGRGVRSFDFPAHRSVLYKREGTRNTEPIKPVQGPPKKRNILPCLFTSSRRRTPYDKTAYGDRTCELDIRYLLLRSCRHYSKHIESAVTLRSTKVGTVAIPSLALTSGTASASTCINQNKKTHTHNALYTQIKKQRDHRTYKGPRSFRCTARQGDSATTKQGDCQYCR